MGSGDVSKISIRPINAIGVESVFAVLAIVGRCYLGFSFGNGVVTEMTQLGCQSTDLWGPS